MIKIENVTVDRDEKMVRAEIVAPLYWWIQYKALTDDAIGATDTTELSFIQHFIYKDFTMNDVCECDIFEDATAAKIESLNELRRRFFAVKGKDKDCISERMSIIRQAELTPPLTYMAFGRITLNYSKLSEIFESKSGDLLGEWIEFCSWVKTLPDSEKIIFNKGE